MTTKIIVLYSLNIISTYSRVCKSLLHVITRGTLGSCSRYTTCSSTAASCADGTWWTCHRFDDITSRLSQRAFENQRLRNHAEASSGVELFYHDTPETPTHTNVSVPYIPLELAAQHGGYEYSYFFWLEFALICSCSCFVCLFLVLFVVCLAM